MTQENILDELKAIFKQISPKMDTDAITPDTRLVEDLGLDSLSILLMSFAIEKRFEFKFDSVQRFATVDEVIEYIASHTA